MAREVVPGLVHVAGNAVVDVVVRDVREWVGSALDGWGDNVQFIERPPEAVLGGGGAAPALLLGRMGQRVVLNANLGKDTWGAQLAAWLRRERVDLLEAAAAATAVNVITIGPDGNRRSLYFTGEKVDWRRSLGAETPQWLLASGYGSVDAGDLAAMHEVFIELRQRGARIAFDPSPWFEGRVEVADMMAAWAQVDCLVGTEEELSAWHRADSVAALAVELLEVGPQQVVVKRGGEGASYAGRGDGAGCVATEKVGHSNTTGAGDTFNGRLLGGLCQGESLRDAVVGAVRTATRAARHGRGVMGALEAR